MSDPKRVVVFCDWQNIYRRAREANSTQINPPAQVGQVIPSELGQLLVERGKKGRGEDRVLQEVRIYRGIPRQERDSDAYKAVRSQMGEWSKNNKVTIIKGRIQYPQDWEVGDTGERPREKGVDVALAVDLVTMAVRREFDVAVVFSADNDLLPAVEFVASMSKKGEPDAPTIEVAAWKGLPEAKRPNRLNPAGGGVWCHWLTTEDYYRIEDTNSYPLHSSSTAQGHPVPRPPQRLNW